MEPEALKKSRIEVSSVDQFPLRERTPADIERQVTQMSPSSPLEELCGAIDAADWLLARAKTIDQLMKQIAMAWIERNGEFDIGEMHYSVGYTSTVKCLNVPQAGHAVLEAAGGDVDRLLEVLVAQPYKHATVRNLIDQRIYGRLFIPHRTGRLINGIPEPLLKCTDKRFLSKPVAQSKEHQ
jgi:hypothetical protein